jgi:ribosomal protein S12 methylthiotransferase
MSRTRAPTVFAITLGCPKNRVDTEVLLGDLLSHGYELAGRPEDADVAVVNTCGFLSAARQESTDTLSGIARRLRPGARLVAAGCMVERFRDEIEAAVPDVSVMLGTRELLALRGVLGGEAPREVEVEGPRLITTPAPSAYLKIAEGCSRRCAFCIIPSLRGRQRSRAADAVVAEARALAAGGAHELVLVAQDLTHWGADLPARPGLAGLVRRLAAEADGVRWLRLMYLFPRDVTDDLLDAIASSPRVLPYLDLPVQHADDRVLAAMRRGTTRRDLLRLVERVRARLPGAVLRTTYLVGFPGETDAAFGGLVDFARAARFEMAGVFAFSPEPGSLAARLPDPVPPRVARQRQKRLQAVLTEIAAATRAGMVGQVHEAVVESVHGRVATGRLWMQAPEVDGTTRIAFRGEGPHPGDFVDVRITGAEGSDFLAERRL